MELVLSRLVHVRARWFVVVRRRPTIHCSRLRAAFLANKSLRLVPLHSFTVLNQRIEKRAQSPVQERTRPTRVSSAFLRSVASFGAHGGRSVRILPKPRRDGHRHCMHDRSGPRVERGDKVIRLVSDVPRQVELRAKLAQPAQSLACGQPLEPAAAPRVLVQRRRDLRLDCHTLCLCLR
eukprot:2110338-Prymnesium_polylepis.3